MMSNIKVYEHAKIKKIYLSCTNLRKLFEDLHQQKQRDQREESWNAGNADRPQWYPQSLESIWSRLQQEVRGQMNVPRKKADSIQ